MHLIPPPRSLRTPSFHPILPINRPRLQAIPSPSRVSRAKFPICQFNSLIDGKEQEKNGPAQLASQVSPGRIPPAPPVTAERNVCEAQRTQVNSNLAGLGASTFPARTASSRERGSASTLRVSPPSSQIFPPPPARLAGMGSQRQPSPRAGQAREEKRGTELLADLAWAAVTGWRGCRVCTGGLDAIPERSLLRRAQIRICPSAGNLAAGHWEPFVAVLAEPKYSPCWFQRCR